MMSGIPGRPQAGVGKPGLPGSHRCQSSEAIQLYAERWREISMVLLDFLLPEMSGEMVFENLQRLNPDVRVVLLTGCEGSVAEKMFEKGLRVTCRNHFAYRNSRKSARHD